MTKKQFSLLLTQLTALAATYSLAFYTAIVNAFTPITKKYGVEFNPAPAPANDATPVNPPTPATPSTPVKVDAPPAPVDATIDSAPTVETQIRNVVTNWADKHLIVACTPEADEATRKHCRDLRAAMIDKMTADEIARVNVERDPAANQPAENIDADQRAALNILADMAVGAGAAAELASWVKKGVFSADKSGAVVTAATFTIGKKSESDFCKALDELKTLYGKNPGAVKSVVDAFKKYATTDAKTKKLYRAIMDLDSSAFNFISADFNPAPVDDTTATDATPIDWVYSRSYDDYWQYWTYEFPYGGAVQIKNAVRSTSYHVDFYSKDCNGVSIHDLLYKIAWKLTWNVDPVFVKLPSAYYVNKQFQALVEELGGCMNWPCNEGPQSTLNVSFNSDYDSYELEKKDHVAFAAANSKHKAAAFEFATRAIKILVDSFTEFDAKYLELANKA